MIFNNLWRRRTRTLLTIVGIAIGVAAVVALSAFGEGIASGFEKTFTSSAADLTVAQRDAMMLLLSAVDEEVGYELKDMSGVDDVVGTVVGVVQMTNSPYFIVMGEDPRGFAIEHYRIVDGAPLSGKRQILLGTLTAKNFKKAVGDNFGIGEGTYRVVGIYETGVSLEDGGAVMTLADAQGAFDKKNQVSYFNVKVRDARRIDEIKAEIEDRWSDLTASRSGEATTQSEALNLYRSFGWFLGIFAVAVGGLGMMNTTLMSVIERTREIGVLRALGWRRWRIVGLILGESLTLALAGGLVGIALGIDLTALTRLSPAVETLLTGVLTPEIFVQAFVIALLLGTLGGLYPAWRASQLQPIDAMRRESGVSEGTGGLARLLARLFGSGALRNLFRRPTRTLVTVIGIGIGVGFVVALIAITEGFAEIFTQLGGAGQVDLLAEEANVSDAGLSEIDERVADRIALRPEVKSVSSLVLGVATQPGLPYFLIFGLDPGEEYIKHYRIREGRAVERTREIMIGRLAANSLKKGVGDKLSVGGSGYLIVGVYETGVAFEDASSVMLLRDAQQVFHKPRKISFIGIALNDPARADAAAQQIERDFPEVMVAQASKMTERMQDIATTYAVVNTLIVLTMLVGGIVMMNAMLMSVFERTQEIGVLRALGWRRGRVIRMVLVESLALSLLSGLAGMAIGVGLASLFTLEPTLGAFLLPSYSPELFAQVLVFALVLGAIGGVYPAWRAANLRPIDALRYE